MNKNDIISSINEYSSSIKIRQELTDVRKDPLRNTNRDQRARNLN